MSIAPLIDHDYSLNTLLTKPSRVGAYVYSCTSIVLGTESRASRVPCTTELWRIQCMVIKIVIKFYVI